MISDNAKLLEVARFISTALKKDVKNYSKY